MTDHTKLTRRRFLSTALYATASVVALSAGTGRALAAVDLSGREMV